MIAKKIDICWHPGMSIFASEPFLQAVSDEYGWLGGFDSSGNLRCVLPYTILKKLNIRLVRFRVETIPLMEPLELREEQLFLESAVHFFRTLKADVIVPASNNAIFRTYPEGALAVPYGSYVIDLNPSEELLWQNIQRIMRQNINSAKKNGVVIKDGINNVVEAFGLVRDTFRRSKLPFMNLYSFQRFIAGLGTYGKVLTAEYQGNAQSYAVFAFSDYCVYAIYAGNIPKQQQGSNKLLYWEAIRLFKKLGCKKFDFYGARISPEPGSKQAELAAFKERFGSQLTSGYMWKYSLAPVKYHLYSWARRVHSGGDIVDLERRKHGR